MSLINTVTQQGRLVYDVECIRGKNKSYAKFSIAVWNGKKDPEQTANFFNCICFGEIAEQLHQYKKGTEIRIVGYLNQRNFMNQETGQKKSIIEIVVQELLEPVRFVDKNNEKKVDDMKTTQGVYFEELWEDITI